MSELKVVDLRTEWLGSPAGVEAQAPRLSWRLMSGRRGARQTAFRVQVATAAAALATGGADLWDSGRVESDNTVDVRYAGRRLVSRQRCYWRVQVWDERGEAIAPSEAAEWEMGLLSPTDWQGAWLAAEDQLMRADREFGLYWVRGPSALEGGETDFRLRFALAEQALVTLFVASFGSTRLWVDGSERATTRSPPVAMGPPTAEPVELKLSAGCHALAVSFRWPSSPLAFVQISGAEIAPFLRIEDDAGVVRRVDAKEWRASQSGEPGWQSVEFDDEGWERVEPVMEARPQPWPPQSAFLLRRVFEISKPIKQARIYATALGAYELHLNGARVGNGLLAPESSDFRRRTLYRVADVTSQIIPGENVLGAVVGDGWYASYAATVGRYAWGAAPRRLLAQLELAYADGEREVIATGPQWRISRSPIVTSELYDGETYDARWEQPGWSAAWFDDSHWDAAGPAPAPAVSITAQIAPPIRRQRVLAARTVSEPAPGVFVFDFGQNFSGWCRLTVTGPRGAEVEMRFAEILKANGEIEQANLRMARARDIYILKGDPLGEIFEPHFTYHGFRYVQLSGFPGIPSAANLEGIVIHSDLLPTGSLDIDQPVIQQLWRNTLWSQRSNFVGIPTDCPQRDERLGWLGDAQVFLDAAAFNMDVDAFTRRFLADVRDGQHEAGIIPDFSPAPVRFVVGQSDKIGVVPHWVGAQATLPQGSTPGWADAVVELPWTLWWRYGDTAVIEENWLLMTSHVSSIADANPDFIWRSGRGADYGDWLALDATSLWEATTPKDLVATAFWARSAACLAGMAAAIGRVDAAQRYRALGASIASAFQTQFLSADGCVGNDSQTGYILALRFALIPPALRTEVAAKLAHTITRRGTLLSTGFLGTSYSLDALADHGYSELAYSLLIRTEFPSWGHMVNDGATTIWETWKGGSGNLVSSFNHYALGAVCGFLFRRIAGIAPGEPGFRRIDIRPLFDARVRKGGGEYISVRGRIATAWTHDGLGNCDLELEIPANTTATVHLPVSETAEITERGQAVAAHPDVLSQRRDANEATIELRSGHYHVAARLAGS